MNNQNANFEEWLEAFIECLIGSGLPDPQAEKFRGQYRLGAESYWEDGWTPEEATSEELSPSWMD